MKLVCIAGHCVTVALRLTFSHVSDIIDNLTVFLTYIRFFFYHVPLYIMMCDNKDFIIISDHFLSTSYGLLALIPSYVPNEMPIRLIIVTVHWVESLPNAFSAFRAIACRWSSSQISIDPHTAVESLKHYDDSLCLIYRG